MDGFVFPPGLGELPKACPDLSAPGHTPFPHFLRAFNNITQDGQMLRYIGGTHYGDPQGGKGPVAFPELPAHIPHKRGPEDLL